MTNELEEKLVTTFPNLYRDHHGDPTHTCMAWGLDVLDGWYELLWELSSKLEALILKIKEESPNMDVGYLPAASQVKEKFGGLRFYMTTATDEMYDLIGKAEDRSYRTCEVCGSPGVESPGGWIVVRCDNHWPKDSKISFDEMMKRHDEPTKED